MKIGQIHENNWEIYVEIKNRIIGKTNNKLSPTDRSHIPKLMKDSYSRLSHFTALTTIHNFGIAQVSCTMLKLVAAVDITVWEENVYVC